MTKTIWNLLLLNFAFIILAVGVYAIGYEYDKANQLYSEAYYFASDASITVYGKRWERLAKLLILLTVIADIVIGFIWFRRKQSRNEKILFINKNKFK
jgi:hypothetical protein